MTPTPALRDLAAPYFSTAGRLALRTFLGLSVTTGLTHASAIGVLLLLARALPPDQFGVSSFALAAQSYCVLFGSLACGSVVIREVVRRPGESDALVTSFFTVTAISSLLVCAGALIAISVAPIARDERWLLSLLAIGTVPAAMSPQALFDARHRQAQGTAVAATAEVSALLAIAGLWSIRALTLPTVGAVYAGKWALIAICQILVYRSAVHRFRWRWSPSSVRVLVGSSWPILLATLFFFVPLSSGVVLVRLRSGPGDAALFGLASQVASAYQIAAALFVQVVQPYVYGEHGLRSRFLVTLTLSSALLLGGAGAAAYVGGWSVATLLLPPFYHAAVSAMPWLLAAAALLAIGRLLSAYLIRFEDGPFILMSQAASAVLYVGGCLALPSQWMIPGAAVLAPGAALVGTAACAWRVRARIREGRSR